MGERKTREEIEQIKKEYNVFDVYSWSRYNLSETDLYSYFLRYILRVQEDRKDSIYSYAGSLVHDLMEAFYDGSKTRQEIMDEYEDKMFELEVSGYKFDRNDEERNTSVSSKYNYCNRHYLENFIPIEGKNIKLEDYILVRIGKFLFNGYSDFEYESDGKKHIVDFKTSTIYKGEKIIQERGQLLLYALSKIQEGWKVEDVVIGWLFTKYVSVDVPFKDGTRTRYIERHEIGSKLASSVRSVIKKIKVYEEDFVLDAVKHLELTEQFLDFIPEYIIESVGEIQRTNKGDIKKAYLNKVKKMLLECPKYDGDEIEMYIEQMSMNNSLEDLPQEVQDRYKIYDCFVEIEFTQKDLDELEQKVKERIILLNKLANEYEKNQDDSIFFQEITKKDSFFHAVLSGYSPKLHKPYKQYLDSLEIKKDDFEIEEDINDILADLGIDI